MDVTYFMQTETVQYRGYKSETVHILLYIERFRHILGRISAYKASCLIIWQIAVMLSEHRSFGRL